MQVWTQQPRDIRSSNIGNTAGGDLRGVVYRDGCYAFVARNTGGKSTHLRLIERLQEEGALEGMALVTHGESEAFLELSPMRVTFRKTPTGEVHEVSRVGQEALPTITPMPLTIKTLVDGDHVGDETSRARRRLKALLQYAPIAASEDFLDTMALAMQGAHFEVDVEDFRDTWARLCAVAKSGKRLRVEPLRSAAEIRAWVAEQKKRNGLLVDHGNLLEILNATGNCGEKALEVARREVAAAEARVEEATQSAARSLGHREAVPPGFVALLTREYDLEALDAEMDAADEEAVKLRRQADERQQITQRTARMRSRLGVRPEWDSSPLDAAKEREAEEREALEAIAQQQQAAERDLATAKGLEERRVKKASDAWADLEQLMRDLKARAFTPRGNPAWGQDLATDASRSASLVTALAVALETSPEEAMSSATAERDRLASRWEAQNVRLEAASSKVGEHRKARTAHEGEVAKWDALDEEISSDEAQLEGLATEEQAQESEAKSSEAREALLIARAAAQYQQLATTHREAIRVVEKTEQYAKAYRKAAQDTWPQLGQIVTSELKLPWLQVDGLEIYLGYSDGKLNVDEAKLERARKQAMSSASPELSAVALNRFLLKGIRASREIEWRLLDSEEDVSTAELHEACLTLMLERRNSLGGIVIVPWEITAALDIDRLRTFDRQCQEAGLVVLTERPRRDGDPEELLLENVSFPGLPASPDNEESDHEG